jgi:hypothetical protein
LHQPGGITESDHGKEVVDAAFEAGAEVLIYSGTSSPSKMTNGSIVSDGMDGAYMCPKPRHETRNLTPDRKICCR